MVLKHPTLIGLLERDVEQIGRSLRAAFGAELEGDFSPCPRPTSRDVPSSQPGLGVVARVPL